MKHFFSFLIMFQFSIATFAQSCHRPLYGCKTFSKELERGLYLQVDSIKKHYVKLILWNLTKEERCAHTMNGHIEVDIQYFNPDTEVWENRTWLRTCGTGAGFSKVKTNSYTRLNYYFTSDNKDIRQNQKVRFITSMSDTIIQSDVVEIPIDPNLFKSEVEQRLTLIEKHLSDNRLSLEKRRDMLHMKALVLLNDDQLIHSLNVLSEISNNYEMTDKIISSYANLLFTYSLKDIPVVEKHIVLCKSIELYARLKNSKEYQDKINEYVPNLKNKLLTKNEWQNIESKSIITVDEVAYGVINNISLHQVKLLFKE